MKLSTLINELRTLKLNLECDDIEVTLNREKEFTINFDLIKKVEKNEGITITYLEDIINLKNSK